MKRDLAAVLADIKSGKGPQLLLVFGEDLQVQEACKTVVDLLVAETHKSFNLERFDGRTVNWDTLQASLVTPPFFPGKKVLWVENAPYFFSREQKGELGERVLQLWNEGKKNEASDLLLDMLVLEGFTQEQWDQLDSVSSGRLLGLFDSERPDARNEAAALLAYCQSREINLSARKGAEGQRLGQWLDQGLPEWDFILLTAVQVDRRTRLYKRLEEIGAVLYLGVERDRSGKLNRETLLEFVTQRARAAGKTLDAQAREMILVRAGEDLRRITHELEKLFLYVADQPSVRGGDVAAIFTDHAADWIFDLTRSIADRDAVAALAHLGRLITQGEHPLKLLGTMAGEVRRLLLARQILENELRGCWRRGMSYGQFQQSMLKQSVPMLTRNPYADYMLFQRADRFTLNALSRYMAEIRETDYRLKSSGRDSRLVMEGLVLNMCLQS
ncbi:MAG: DNA polymerase III subunit delta [Alphaproteobacteria bacterium]